jgi:hypothetical protein
LDLNRPRGLLTMQFNEPVSPTTIDVTGIQLQSTKVSGAGTESYRLTGGDLDAASAIPYGDFVFGLRSVSIVLTEADQTMLKTNFALSTAVNNTFLVADSKTIADTAGNQLAAVVVSDALGISDPVDLVIDGEEARVTDIQVDFDLKKLSVKFDDVVDASTLKVHSFTFHNAEVAASTDQYELQSSTTSSSDGYLMVIDLSQTDELELNRKVTLATELANTYLTMTAQSFNDMDGRDVIAITTGMQVSHFVNDTTPPKLDGFSINLSDETMELRFSEPVRLTTFDPTAITLSNGMIPADYEPEPEPEPEAGSEPEPEPEPREAEGESLLLQLTGGSDFQISGVNFEISDPQKIVRFKLLKRDLDALKLIDGLFTSANDSFVAHTNALIRDMFAVPVVPISLANPLAVDGFSEDLVAPELLSFTVDMDAAFLTMSFSEPLRMTTFVVPSNLILVGDQAGGVSVGLSADDGVSSTDAMTVLVNITHDDMHPVKINEPFFSDLESSFLLVQSALVQDMRGNAISAILQPDAMPASEYSADTTSPSLVNFAVSLNGGSIRLNFDEPVRAASLNMNGTIAVQGDAAGAVQHTLTLTGGDSTSPDDSGILIRLLTSDLNSIKRYDDLFTDIADSYISFTADLISDMAGNAVNVAPASSAAQAALYIDDQTSPVLLSFDLNMAADPGTVKLFFSETVRASSFDPRNVTLSPYFNSTSRPGLQLSGGNLTSTEDSTELDLTLRKADFDTLKLKGFGTGLDKSWLTMAAGCFTDMAGALSTPVIDGVNAMPPSNIVLDSTRPQVEAFDINVNTGHIDLYFSEPVRASSLEVSRFELTAQAMTCEP